MNIKLMKNNKVFLRCDYIELTEDMKEKLFVYSNMLHIIL